MRESVFLPFLGLQRAVRDERWKLIVQLKISHWQLFDLKHDPEEKRALAGRAEFSADVARLRGLMKVGDTLPLPREKLSLPHLDLTGKVRKTDQWQPEWIVKKYFTEW